MTIGTISSPTIRSLRPVLEQWSALNNQLGKNWCVYGDTPWWYSERAFVSVFAGAVWRSGGCVFEEYSDLKRRLNQRVRGRVDLWFSFGPHEFLAEVKHCWLAATACRDQTEKVAKCMDEAKADVRCVHPDGMRRLAIVFGSPEVAQRHRTAMRPHIAWLTKQAASIKTGIDADAVAWTFPPLKRFPSSVGLVYPGALMWIKEVKR